MKKTALLAVALATCLGYAPARAADVVSANIVGYNKITLYPGLNMIGGLFQAVGTDSSYTLQDQFQNAKGTATAGTTDGEADTVMKYDGTTQSYDAALFYYADPDYPDPSFDYKWLDGNYAVTDEDVTDGRGGWYRNRALAPIELTMAGEVPTNSEYSVTINPGLNFVANPYPAPIKLNSAYFVVESPVFGTTDGEADTVMSYDGATQSYNDALFYYADADYPDPAFDYKWLDGNYAVTQASIEPGQGFWYRHRGGGTTLTFKKPY